MGVGEIAEDHPRYSDSERRDGTTIEDNLQEESTGEDPENVAPDEEEPNIPETSIPPEHFQPWRGLLRKTDSKININE